MPRPFEEAPTQGDLARVGAKLDLFYDPDV